MSSGWREFDDSKVYEISESWVTTKAAYVLFYRQRSVPVAAVPPPVSPGSVPITVSTPIPSETSVLSQTMATQSVSSSQTVAAPADIKTVTPMPPALTEFNEAAWQTDMEAIDWCCVCTLMFRKCHRHQLWEIVETSSPLEKLPSIEVRPTSLPSLQTLTFKLTLNLWWSIAMIHTCTKIKVKGWLVQKLELKQTDRCNWLQYFVHNICASPELVVGSFRTILNYLQDLRRGE